MECPTSPVLVALRALLPFALTLVRTANFADAVARRRRRHLTLAGVVALTLGACAHHQARPEATAPQIDRLECGGKSCTITTSGRATIVWVSE
jgi:hypothetical protein